MKIKYTLTKKELWQHLNIAYGIIIQKRKLVHHPKKQLQNLKNIIFKEYIIGIIYFIGIFFLGTIFTKKWQLRLLFLLWSYFMIVPLIITISMIISYLKSKKHSLAGTIQINDSGIEDITKNNHILVRSWPEINYGLYDGKTLYLFDRHKTIFIIPMKENTNEIKKMLEKYLPNKIISKIKKDNKKTLKEKLEPFTPYVLLIIMVMVATIYYHYQSQRLLNYEYLKIENHQLDDKIYTKASYENIEKSFKEFYKIVTKEEEIYQENSAKNIFKKLTVPFLDKEKEQLLPLLKSLEEKKEKQHSTF